MSDIMGAVGWAIAITEMFVLTYMLNQSLKRQEQK